MKNLSISARWFAGTVVRRPSFATHACLVLSLAGCNGCNGESTSTTLPTAAAMLELDPIRSDTVGGLIARSGSVLSEEFTVRVLANNGAAVSRANVSVNVAAVAATGAKMPGVGITSDSVAQTDAYGRARFSALVLHGTAGCGRLLFSATGMGSVSLPLCLRAGAVAAQASDVVVAPDSVPVGGTAQVIVTLVDDSGNRISGEHAVAARVTGGTGTGTLSPMTLLTNDSTWRGTFVGVTSGSTMQLMATADGVPLPASRSLTVIEPTSAMNAVSLALVQAPADTAAGFPVASGEPLPALTIALRDAASRFVERAGVAVSVDVLRADGTALPGALLAGGAPVSTNAQGRASFPQLAVTSTNGPLRLKFQSNGLTPTSFRLAVRAGSASATGSTLDLSDTKVPIGGTVVATVIARDAAGNKLGAGHAVVFAASGGTSIGTFSTPVFTPGDSTYRSTFTGTTAGTTALVSAVVDGVVLTTTRPLTVQSLVAATDAVFTINNAITHEVSRYIYGANFVDDVASYGNATPPAELTLNRMGGNRLSAYNWENNYSNAGLDFEFHNDRFLHPLSTNPGEAVKARAALSFARGQAFMATIPMLGYVSADACGCDVGTKSSDRAQRLLQHFVVSRPFKGAPLSSSPDRNDGFVFQDEFVKWFETTSPCRSTHATAPVFFSLDNEPDIWHSTHREIQSNLNDDASTPRYQTYDGLSDTSIAYARAVKSVLPDAKVFGPAVATYAGVATAGRYPSPDPVYGSKNFIDIYLDRFRTAEATYGRRLLDVLDLHWYPAAYTSGGEITNDFATQDSATIETRIQAPRSLWDPSFDEHTWVSGVTGGPIRLIPRLREQIAAHYPGTKVAITEYYFGRGGDISGGIAQADVLGIFGREGVFAASLWPQINVYAPGYSGDGNKAYAYIFAAFRMFLNYDGKGGKFGDTGLQVTSNDVAGTSVYASRDAAGQIVIVAINKGRTARNARITVQSATGLTKARVFTLTAAQSRPVSGTDIAVANGTNFNYMMPALSVTTLVVTP